MREQRAAWCCTFQRAAKVPVAACGICLCWVRSRLLFPPTIVPISPNSEWISIHIRNFLLSIAHTVHSQHLSCASFCVDVVFQKLAIHYSRKNVFWRNQSTNNEQPSTHYSFIRHSFQSKIVSCKSANISFEFCPKIASLAKQRQNDDKTIAAKNIFAETTNNHLHTIRILPTLRRFVDVSSLFANSV